jgi:hypothetical protein
MVDLHIVHGTNKWFDSTCEAGFALGVLRSMHAQFEKFSSGNTIGQIRSVSLDPSEYLS